jgi:bacillithiol biosynthesis cysteine-adding enzyme BshC
MSLAELHAHGSAFVALAGGDRVLDDYLPPLRRLEAAASERRARIEIGGRDALWAAVDARAARLGAPPAARQAIEAVRRGAPVVFTGQQPGLFAGPVFTLYKAATAVLLARQLAAGWGEPVVALFWVASDDADFDEIASATIAGQDLALHTMALDSELKDGELMVGHLPAVAGRKATAEARAVLASTPHGASALELAGSIWERGGDWGEGFAAAIYALLGDQGLIVVDAREAALRELARPFLARVLDDVAGFSATVDAAGEALERAGLERQLRAFASAFPFWHEEPPRRRRLAGDHAHGNPGDEARRILMRERGGGLWPSAALRPLVVDSALPTVARVLGPAEVAYMAQLAPAYARLGVPLPPAVPRLTATLIPPRALRLAEAIESDVGSLLTAWAPSIETFYRRRLPPAVRRALTELETAQRDGFARAREALGAFGPGLNQLVDSVAGKADFQLRRLWEAAIKREKSRSAADDPELRHLPSFLRPDQGLQERGLAVVGALALAGPELVPAVLRLAEEHLTAVRAGRAGHALLPIPPELGTER